MARYLDYAAGTIPASAIVAAGFQGTVRYVTSPGLMNPPGHNQKHMTPVEYADHRAHGLTTLFVYQGGTGDADTGRAGGVINAQRALAGMKYLGAPIDTPCFVVNDRTTLPNPGAWQEYIRGARSVLGRVGAYGFLNAIDSAWGVADWYWQCGAQSAVRPGCNLYQHNDIKATVAGQICDINDVRIPVGDTVAEWSDNLKDWDVNPETGKPDEAAAYVWLIAGRKDARLAREAAEAVAAREPAPVDYDRIVNGVVEKLTSGKWQLDIVSKADTP